MMRLHERTFALLLSTTMFLGTTCIQVNAAEISSESSSYTSTEIVEDDLDFSMVGEVEKIQKDELEDGLAEGLEVENIIVFDDTEETLAEDAAQESTEEANMESSEENIEDDAIPADDMDNLPEELPEDFYTVFPTGGVIDEEPLVDIESVSDGQKRLFRSGLLPEEYVTPELPPLRKQSPYGTCWAFATTALVEINLMKNGFMSDPDMSELHLAYFTYNTETDPLGGTEGDVIKK